MITFEKLTPYQKAQLLHLAIAGEFRLRKANGRKVSAGAWRKMIAALTAAGGLEEGPGRRLMASQAGREWCRENHTAISFAPLD